MSITIGELFYGAYRDAGLIKLAQTGLSPDQMEEARQLYNRMTNAWKTDGLLVSHVFRQLFPLTPNKADYSIGNGGDWDTEWPERIEVAGIVLTTQDAQPEYPIYPLTLEEWQGWTLKEQVTNWPRRYFYERSFPLGIFHVLYVPTDANSIALYLEECLIRIDATADATIDFQPGYQEAIETNLARRLAARYPGEAHISQDTITLSRSSLDQLRAVNNRPQQRVTDWGPVRRSNVFAGNRYQR